MTTPQLTTILFHGSSGERKAQQVLKQMYKQKQLKRTRKGIGLNYTYYLTTPATLITEFTPHYTLNGRTFHALIKTTHYTLVDNNRSNYDKVVTPQPNFPILLVLEGSE